MILQPVDWYEHDVDGMYTIEVFGRLEDKSVVCVRLTGFKPYLYAHEKPDTDAIYEASNKKWIQNRGPNKGEQEYAFNLSSKIHEHIAPKVTKVEKYDTMAGFGGLKKLSVWKVECDSLASFSASKKCIK